jgi:poly(rC)-binding protein 2/3/4
MIKFCRKLLRTHVIDYLLQYFERQNGSWGGLVPPLVFKLIVPATQCGSIIGKGGAKIKEIRESSGASIQVASDMLPSSTERTVTITGTPETITQCIYQVCLILMEVSRFD